MVQVYLALYKGKAAINTRAMWLNALPTALYDWQHAARTAIVKSLLSTHATACLIVIRLARETAGCALKPCRCLLINGT